MLCHRQVQQVYKWYTKYKVKTIIATNAMRCLSQVTCLTCSFRLEEQNYQLLSISISNWALIDQERHGDRDIDVHLLWGCMTLLWCVCTAV